MNTKQLNVNFRWDKKRRLFICRNWEKYMPIDKYTCYDLSSGEHFEATKEYIRTTEVATVKKRLIRNKRYKSAEQNRI